MLGGNGQGWGFAANQLVSLVSEFIQRIMTSIFSTVYLRKGIVNFIENWLYPVSQI